MSFVRLQRRSQSTSSLNSSIVGKKRKPKPAWDDSVSDLTQHQATREEIDRRRYVHQSKNLDTVRQEKLEKQIAKAKATEESLKNTSSYNSTRLLREILYDQSQLEDALSHSDRVMAVVQDLFGDDPKRKTGFPNITLAPGQKAGYRPQGPLMTAPETPSRLTILSESVMDPHALNDMGEDENYESDSDGDKENLPVSYQGSMNIDRFQSFIRKQQAKQANHPYDSTHASLLQDHGNIKTGKDRKQPTHELGSSSLNSTHSGEGDIKPATMAINDTVKVKKKSRSRIEKDVKEGEDKKGEALNLSTVLRGLEQEMTDYEVATGRQPNSGTQGNASLLSSNVPGVSGYTSLLVQTIAKLIGYLKETEARWLEERHVREQMQYQIAEQRILLDAITADLLATQDLQLQNQQEFNQSTTQTQLQIRSIQELLSGLGLQEAVTIKPTHTSGQRNLCEEHITQQSIESRVSSHQGPGAPKEQPLPRHAGNSGFHRGPNAPAHGGPSASVHQGPSASVLQAEKQLSYQQHQPGSLGLQQHNQRQSQQQPGPEPYRQAHQSTLQQPPQPLDFHQSQPVNHQTVSHEIPPQIAHSKQPSSQLVSQSIPHEIPPQFSQSKQPSSQLVAQLSRLSNMQSELNRLQTGSSGEQSLFQGHSVNGHPQMQTHRTATDPVDRTTSTSRQDLEVPPSATSRSPHNLADEFFNALQQATSRTETASQPSTQNTTSTNKLHQIPRMTNTANFPPENQTRNSNLIQSNVAKFTSSFLEDKRHLGTRDTIVPFQPAILLSPPRQRDRSTVVRPKVTSVGAQPMSSQDGMAVGTIHSMQRGAHHLLQSAVYDNSISHQSDSDIASRIAQLTKQHEEAQNRLCQFESDGQRYPDSRIVANGQGSVQGRTTHLSQPLTAVSNRLSNSTAHPVSPPISPIPYEHPPIKQVKRGASHFAKEGRTIHVSIPRPDDLEISATSTPSPKTAENRTKARLSNSSQGSHQWKTPERRNDGSEEEQFFALTAHMST